MLDHIIRLPLLKMEPQPLMTVVLLVRLILVILDHHELGIPRLRVQAQAHETRDGGRLGDETERPGLLVLELDELVVGADDFVGFVDGRFEELGQGEPLPGHFVAVVGVDKLVVVDAVGRVAFYTIDGGVAAVEGDDLWGGLLGFLCLPFFLKSKPTSSTSLCRAGLNSMLLLGFGV